jgi:hypothetical protein
MDVKEREEKLAGWIVIDKGLDNGKSRRVFLCPNCAQPIARSRRKRLSQKDS